MLFRNFSSISRANSPLANARTFVVDKGGEKKKKELLAGHPEVMRGIRITKGRGTSSILSSASPCMHRYQAAHVCTVCYAHARNALRTQSNRKPRVFQFMSRPRTVWTPVVFEILVEASPLEASVALEFSRFRLESSAIRIAPSHLRYRHLDSMLAYILGFFYFYAELLRLELQMLVHPEDYKLSKFML